MGRFWVSYCRVPSVSCTDVSIVRWVTCSGPYNRPQSMELWCAGADSDHFQLPLRYQNHSNAAEHIRKRFEACTGDPGSNPILRPPVRASRSPSIGVVSRCFNVLDSKFANACHEIKRECAFRSTSTGATKPLAELTRYSSPGLPSPRCRPTAPAAGT